MKTTIHIAFSLLLGIILMTSCTIEKRTYMSGWHVEWKKNGKTKDDIHCPVEGKSKADLEDDERYVKPSTPGKDSIQENSVVTETPDSVIEKKDSEDGNTVKKSPQKEEYVKIEKPNPGKLGFSKKVRYHPKATASFILGWLFFIPYLGIISVIISLALGSIAIREIRNSDGKYRGIGLVRAGRIPVYIFMLLLLIYLIAIFTILAL